MRGPSLRKNPNPYTSDAETTYEVAWLQVSARCVILHLPHLPLIISPGNPTRGGAARVKDSPEMIYPPDAKHTESAKQGQVHSSCSDLLPLSCVAFH